MCLITIVVVCITAVAAAPSTDVALRIVGGTTVPIPQWPQMANVLFTWNFSTFEPFCGGAILNANTILTAAHCINFHPPNRFRVRTGSALASSGGTTHNVAELIPHPFYSPTTENFDIGLIRLTTVLNFTLQVQSARIAGINYTLDDNEIVHALGWGAEEHNGPRSEQLRQIQIRTINQRDCARHYSTENIVITDNMLCAGWLDVGGRGQCDGDDGTPLFHNGVIVGVYSFSIGCGTRFYPSVNTRVSRVSDWINANI